MAYEYDSTLMGGEKKSQTNKQKKKTPAQSTTVPMDTLTKLPPLPEKQPATIIHPSAAAAPGGIGKDSAAGAAGRRGSAPLYTGGEDGAQSTAAPPAESAPAERLDFLPPQRDAEAQRRYDEARETLAVLQGKAPEYDSRYDAQIQSLYEQITGRAPFRYDSATDPLYQQYVQDYTGRGALAMRDTMGRAAALTGGYGSSYAQSVGQQQYDAYLQRLADILPDTYGMALDAYKAEGDELQRRLDTTAALEKSDYGRYLDELGQYNRSLDRAQEDADRARSEMLYDEDRAYSRAEDDYARRLAAQKDAYARLLKLIDAGYRPSAQELALAGLSSAQGAALMAQATAPSSPTVIIRREKASGKSSSSKRSSSKISSSKGVKKTQGSLKK